MSSSLLSGRYDVTGTTLNLLKFPVMNPKPTVLYRRVQRLKEQTSLIAEEERLRRQQFRETRSPKYATLMGTQYEIGNACMLFVLSVTDVWFVSMFLEIWKHKRVVFKTVVLVWKCLNVTAHSYLSELCVPVASASGRQHLRSASMGLLQVPRAWSIICRWSFAVAKPSLWNSLPISLWRQEMTLHTFKRQLKAYLFHTRMLVNRRNIRHRLALLWRFSRFWRHIQTYRLTYLDAVENRN